MTDPSTSFPLDLGELRLELVESDDEHATVRQIVLEDGLVVDVKEQSLRWAELRPTEPPSLVERVQARTKRVDPALCMPWDLLRPPSPFLRVGPFDEPVPQLWHAAVVSAVYEQAQARGFEQRFECLEDWPAEAVTTYFLWVGEFMLGATVSRSSCRRLRSKR